MLRSIGDYGSPSRQMHVQHLQNTCFHSPVKGGGSDWGRLVATILNILSMNATPTPVGRGPGAPGRTANLP